MTLLIVCLTAPLLLLLLLGMRYGRAIELRRAVLLHAPPPRVWESVRRLPALLTNHGRAQAMGALDRCTIEDGDGESPGSVWRIRGRWGRSPYWADVKIARCAPGREIAVRLLRDSLRTDRGLRDHLGTLTMEPSEGGTKLTWHLQADLRGPRLILARLLARRHLQARLLDLRLRSLKIALDRANGDEEAATQRHARGGAPHSYHPHGDRLFEENRTDRLQAMDQEAERLEPPG